MSQPDTATRMVVDPFFLDAPGGRLFAVHHRPAGSGAMRGHVLVVPPFNEEMNRCRSMIAMQARALAALGIGTLLVDLHGTGDSEGLYRDARWSTWLEDLQAAHRWASARSGGCRALLGIRLGAILAAQLHVTLARPHIDLVLWQPVVDGKLHLTQFLRVRMAAQLDRPDLPKETTASMRKQLAEGRTLEVAGYEIHPELASAIDAARLTDHAPKASGVLWLDNVSAEQPELSVPTRSAIDAWAAAGVKVDALAYTGPAFWQLHERVVNAAIVEHTTRWIGQKWAA
jgi:exosortase A-associated hydrolase 2